MKNANREKIREAILNGVNQAMDTVENQYDAASEKTSEFVDTVKERAAKTYSDAKEKAVMAKEKTDKYVRENPEKSLLIAAGAGALVAMVAMALMRKKKS